MLTVPLLQTRPIRRRLSAGAVGRRLVPLAVVLGAAGVWELLSGLGLISQLLYPPPSRTLSAAAVQLVQGRLLDDLVATLWRLSRGMALGTLAGLLLGLVTGYSRRLRTLVDPLIALIHPLPKIALLPLFMIIFGLGDSSRVVVISLAAFFPVVINTMAGVAQISPTLFEVAEDYGASTSKVLSRIVLPGSLPMAMAGVRVALNTAMVVTIAVELVASSDGLGAMIWFSWQTLRTEHLYATLWILAGFGVVTNTLLHLAERRLVPWAGPGRS